MQTEIGLPVAMNEKLVSALQEPCLVLRSGLSTIEIIRQLYLLRNAFKLYIYYTRTKNISDIILKLFSYYREDQIIRPK